MCDRCQFVEGDRSRLVPISTAMRRRAAGASMTSPASSRIQVAVWGTGAGVAEKRIGSSVLVGGAEKNSRYAGGCRKSAKRGLGDGPPGGGVPDSRRGAWWCPVREEFATRKGLVPRDGGPGGLKAKNPRAISCAGDGRDEVEARSIWRVARGEGAARRDAG